MKVARLIILKVAPIILTVNLNCFASTLVDPMKPKTIVPVELNENKKQQESSLQNNQYTLKLIAGNNNERICMINGETLHVGDNIDDYEVVEITENSVIIKNKLEKVIILTIY